MVPKIRLAIQSISIARIRNTINGEADDDSWYFAEMQTLEDELESLQKQRNDAEYKARDWRAKADEAFTFARYAKEDFDSDDLEKKRSVIVKLGEVLTIMDRTIHFTPNKYFLPVENMNESKVQFADMVRTNEKDPFNRGQSRYSNQDVLRSILAPAAGLEPAT